MKSRLHILITADKNYLVPALTTMFSLVVANENRNNIVFHYAWEKSDNNIQTLIINALSGFENVELFFYQLDLSFLRGTREITYAPNSYMTYARLFAATFLPPDIERLVYLDSDILVMKDIAALFNIDMAGCTAMAVPGHYNYIATPFSVGVPFCTWEETQTLTYFNTGVLLIDMHKWRTVSDKFEYVIKHSAPELLVHVDQTVLNYVLKNAIGKLDMSWNRWAGHKDAPPSDVLHFIGKQKPWNHPRCHRAAKVWMLFYTAYVKPRIPEQYHIHKKKGCSRKPDSTRFLFSVASCINCLSLLYPRTMNDILDLLAPKRTEERKKQDLENLLKQQEARKTYLQNRRHLSKSKNTLSRIKLALAWRTTQRALRKRQHNS